MKVQNLKYIIAGFLIFNLQFLMLSEAQAQQLPLYSSYVYNPYLLSPSFAGSLGDEDQTARLMLGHRYQYAGFEGAPSTSVLTLDAPMLKNMGLGGTLYTDKMGLIRQTGLELGYAYRINFNDKATWHLGLSGNAGQQTLDFDGVVAEDITEDILNIGTANKVYINATFGTHVDIQKLTLGFAVQQLTRNQLVYQNYVSNVNFDYGMAPHMLAHVSYQLNGKSGKWGLKPMVVGRIVQGLPAQFDVILKGDYKNKLYITAGYRGGYAASFGVGAKLSKNLILSYTYDHMINDAGPFTGGGNEFTLGYNFFKGSKAPVFDQPVRTDIASDIEQGSGLTQEDVDRLFDEKVAKMREEMQALARENETQRAELQKLNNTIEKLQLTNEEMQVEASKVVVKDGFVTNDLAFETGSAWLNPASNRELDRVAAYMLVNKDVQLDIGGHSDAAGNADVNLILSKKRAAVVYDYLVARGVEAKRMTHEGYGDAKPNGSNETDEGKKQNRRVELKIR